MCTAYFGWRFCDYTWQKSARLYLARKLILEWRYNSLSGLQQRNTALLTPSEWNHRPPVKHDDVIKWKHFPLYWPFVRGIHRPPVNSPHKGQWRGALVFSLICTRINGWVNNGEAGDLRRHQAHYDVIVMKMSALHAVTMEQNTQKYATTEIRVIARNFR